MIRPIGQSPSARRFCREIRAAQQQISAAFDAGRLLLRGRRDGLGLVETVNREAANLDRRVREHLRRVERDRVRDRYGGFDRPSDFANFCFGVDSAEVLAGDEIAIREQAIEQAVDFERRISERLAERARDASDALASAAYYGQALAVELDIETADGRRLFWSIPNAEVRVDPGDQVEIRLDPATPAGEFVPIPQSEFDRELIRSQRRANRLATEILRWHGVDPGEPGGDQTVVARVCLGQVHEPDSGCLNHDDVTMTYSCAICGHTWAAVELAEATDLAAIGIVARHVLVSGPDGDEFIVLDARADAQAGQLLRGATLQSIAEQTERAGFAAGMRQNTGALRSSLSAIGRERIRAGLPITIGTPRSDPGHPWLYPGAHPESDAGAVNAMTADTLHGIADQADRNGLVHNAEEIRRRADRLLEQQQHAEDDRARHSGPARENAPESSTRLADPSRRLPTYRPR